MVTGPARIDKLIQLLAEQRKFGSVEIAETLWLAMQIEPEAQEERPAPTPRQADDRTVPDITDSDAPVAPPPPPEREAPAPRVTVATPAPQAGVLPTAALPVWIADPAMLRDPLAVMRSLKPLLRQVETGPGRRLDERATVDAIARTQLWLPVLEAESEPWFDIVLIVDGSSSMHLWQRLVGDLGRIFRRYGAFRDLQVFDLVVDGTAGEDAVQLRSHPNRPGHRPSELIEQRGRRIAILLSDCTAPYWWDGTLLPMLQDWAKVMPTVVWQMLPEWMWARTALGRGQTVSLSNGTPGAANQRLMALPVDGMPLSESEQKQLPVPVVTSEPEDLRNWSLMLAGDRRELTPGYLLPQFGGTVPKAKPLEELAREQLTGEEEDEAAALEVAIEAIAQKRIQRFLQLSSPEARRLVMLLAAAPVITLPVMRLIRDSMMVQDESQPASPLPVAEVFLSGLLRQVPEQDVPAADDIEQALNDVVQYDFVPKARRLLLDVLPEVDTVEVFNSVSAAVEERWDRFSTEDFKAFLLNPEKQEPKALTGIRSFASVTVEILKPLGGQYESLADSLQAAANPEVTTPNANEPEDDFEIPPLKTLEFYRAEVREEAPPVQLLMDEFTIATVEIEESLEDGLGIELEAIASIADESSRAMALCELAPRLEGAPFTLLVRVAQEIESERDRLNVFSTLLPYLPERLQGQVQELINELERQIVSSLIEFEIEVATLTAQKTGWEVHREPDRAYEFVEALGEKNSLEMVAIPAGTFTMGSPENEPERYDSEAPQHKVKLKSFFMGRYPVTQAQWRFVAGLEQVNRALRPDPSRFKGDDRPVERVSWYEAVEFCDRLSQYTDNKYQLPTEAQWEYACRAGTTTLFHFGETISPELANYISSQAYNGGPRKKRPGQTTIVNYFGIANAFGLSDMHGNVLEWCADHWHENYEAAPTDGSAWLTNNKDGNRVLRGGSWNSFPKYCCSAARYSPSRYDSLSDYRDSYTGFRISCLAPRTQSSAS